MAEIEAEGVDDGRARAIIEQLVVPAVSVVIAIAIGAILMWILGYDPLAGFSALFTGAFGGGRQIGEVLMRSTPLIFTGLAVAYGFRAGLFNIGAEGQLFMGGLAAAFLGIQLAGMPQIIVIPAILVAGAFMGAAWAFIPAVLKARVGAHEVITTMMFTYIARYFVSYLARGPLRAEGQIPQTERLPAESIIPRIHETLPFLPDSRLHWGFLIAVALAVLVWLLLKYTTLGYEARAVGFNQWASETGGISVQATIVKSLCISGALAGLAGVIEVIAVQHRLFDQFSSGFGFTGIAVALLAKNNPLGVIFAAILFGALSTGAGTMQLEAEIPQDIVLVIQALIIFLVAAERVSKWLIRRPSKKGALESV